MDRPKQLTVNRDGVQFVIGEDGDFSWKEMDSLQLQIDRHNMHHPKDAPVRKVSPETLLGVLAIKKMFPGAVVEDWSK